VAVARFTRTLGTLISSGVPILGGLLITARSRQPRRRKAVMQARQHVTGRHAVRAAEGDAGVPPMVVHMIAVGENTGPRRDAQQDRDFYDDEVDAAVTALTSLLEPMMICSSRGRGRHRGGDVPSIFKMVTLVK